MSRDVRPPGPRYQVMDAALLRAAIHDGTDPLPAWPEADTDPDVDSDVDSGAGDDPARWRAWLGQVWSQQWFAAAVAVASPQLAERVRDAVAPDHHADAGTNTNDTRDTGEAAALRRLALSLARYHVRAGGRATPFGLFAGVAPARTGTGAGNDAGNETGNEAEEGPAVSWNGPHRIVRRVDAAWLARIIARLESCPPLRARLPVTANDLAIARAGRLTLARRSDTDRSHAPTTGQSGAREISIRLGSVVERILDLTQAPRTVTALAAELSARYPSAAPERLDEVIAQMIEAGFLVTALRPPATSRDGLAHVLAVLHEVRAHELDDVHGLVADLDALAADLPDALGDPTHPTPFPAPFPSPTPAPAAAAAAGPDALARVQNRMRVLAPGEDPVLATHLGLSTSVTLPRAVIDEAERAAETLLRLTRHPHGRPSWRRYHAAFLDRFGVDAVVELHELIDPNLGLGFPEDFTTTTTTTTAAAGRAGHAGHAGTAAELSVRDERLLRLAQQAALDGAEEVDLDDDLLAELTGLTDLPDVTALGDASGPPDPTGPAHLELAFELRADTLADAADGVFWLVVTGAGRSALTTTGRFHDVLDPRTRVRMRATLGHLPVSVRDAVPAQMSFPALRPHLDNVTTAPEILPTQLSLGEHHDDPPGPPRPPGRLRVRDLLVTADEHRFVLFSRVDGRPVEPVVGHPLAPHLMPPLARLIDELPRATTATITPFTWGAATALPYLPRLRRGNTVLSEARWRLDPRALPGPDASLAQWRAALERTHGGLPDLVHVGDGDRRLRLHLDRAADAALLREHLRTHTRTHARTHARTHPGPVTLSHAPRRSDHGWLDGRAHELVLPLTTTTAPSPAPAALAHRTPTTGPARGMAADALRGARPIRSVRPVRPGGRSRVPLAHLPGAGDVVSARLDCLPETVPVLLAEHLPELFAMIYPRRWWFLPMRHPHPHLRLRLVIEPYREAIEEIGVWAADLRGEGLCGDLVFDTYRPELARYGGTSAAMAAAEAVFDADSAAALAQAKAVAGRCGPRLHPEVLTAVSLVDLADALHGGRAEGLTWLLRRADLARDGRLHDAGLHRRARHLDATHAARPDHRTSDDDTDTDTGDDDGDGDGDGDGVPAPVRCAWAERRAAVAQYREVLAGLDPPHDGPARDRITTSMLHLHTVRALGVDPVRERATHRLARGLALAATLQRRPTGHTADPSPGPAR